MFGMGPPKPLSVIMFEKHDTDKSGFIDIKEFQHLCFSLGYTLTSVELDLAVKLLDEDASGKIEQSEFTNWWKQSDRWSQLQLDEEELAQRSKAANVFNEFDKNKSGFISGEHFNEFHSELVKEKLTTKDLEAARRDLDKNNDGKIVFSEYIEWLTRQGAIKIKLPTQ